MKPRHHRDMNEAITALVRRHDPDRFLTALFAPPERRDALMVLYAFNHELARAREVASEPPLALIRLQWWREVVEGEDKRHEVASPLTASIAAGVLKPSLLLPVIEAREAEVYGDFETIADWRAWLLAGAGGLAVAAAAALAAPDAEVARPFGAAYGAAGTLRATGVLAGQGTCLMPREVLQRHDLSFEAFIDNPGSVAARAALSDMVAEAKVFLFDAQRGTMPGGKMPGGKMPGGKMPRSAIAAILPAVLARRDLARWPAVATPRRLGDRLAVVFAGATGRV